MIAIIRKKKNPKVLGEVLLWHISDRLKREPHSPQSKRISHILELLIELKQNVGTYGALQTLRKLEKPIDRYRFRYQLAVGSGVRAGLRAAGSNLSANDWWEYGAVLSLLKILDQPNGLDRIHKCDCGSLFFADKRSDQKFCGATCRQRHYDRDGAKRDLKRTYMRTRYAKLKALANNPKSGIGLRTRARALKKDI
jgi:hypothetical protein